MIGLEALGGDRLEFGGKRGKREQQAGRHLFGPILRIDGAGVEDSRTSVGIDIDAHFGGVLQQALGVFEGLDEEAGDSYVVWVVIVLGIGHRLDAPFRTATVYLALVGLVIRALRRNA